MTSNLFVVELLLPSGKPFRRSKPMSMEDAEEMVAQFSTMSSQIVPAPSTTAPAGESEMFSTRAGAFGAQKND